MSWSLFLDMQMLRWLCLLSLSLPLLFWFGHVIRRDHRPRALKSTGLKGYKRITPGRNHQVRGKNEHHTTSSPRYRYHAHVTHSKTILRKGNPEKASITAFHFCVFSTDPGRALQPMCSGFQLWADARGGSRRRNRQHPVCDPDEQRTHGGVRARRWEPYEPARCVSHERSSAGEERAALLPTGGRHHVRVLGSRQEHETRRERTNLQRSPKNSKKISKCENVRCDQ